MWGVAAIKIASREVPLIAGTLKGIYDLRQGGHACVATLSCRHYVDEDLSTQKSCQRAGLFDEENDDVMRGAR